MPRSNNRATRIDPWAAAIDLLRRDEIRGDSATPNESRTFTQITFRDWIGSFACLTRPNSRSRATNVCFVAASCEKRPLRHNPERGPLRIARDRKRSAAFDVHRPEYEPSAEGFRALDRRIAREPLPTAQVGVKPT